MIKLNELRELNLNEILFSILLFLGILSPGVLILYRFKPAEFFNLNPTALVILSISITLPFLLIDIIRVVLTRSITGKQQTIEKINVLTECSIDMFLILYVALFTTYIQNITVFREFLFSKLLFYFVMGEIVFTAKDIWDFFRKEKS